MWHHLLTAVAQGKNNPNGYTYALASQHSPETLTVWHDGRVVLKTLVNTGIPGLSHRGQAHFSGLPEVLLQLHEGKPDGSKYHDPVYYANYFNGGDAVHQFSRYSYGLHARAWAAAQSPWDAAKTAYGYLSYGSLVTVTGPVA